MIARRDITGLVLAGGRASRMGGVDKGLELHLGTPLALHALRRLAPQVATTAINANRNLPEYELIGAPIWPDVLSGQPGPLAGLLTGCERCTTRYLAAVPCDAPMFPLDLVAHLAHALEADDAEIAIAATVGPGTRRIHPVFCLLDAALGPRLRVSLAAGQRKVAAWVASRRCVEVEFMDASAFTNVNTHDDLRALQPRS